MRQPCAQRGLLAMHLDMSECTDRPENSFASQKTEHAMPIQECPLATGATEHAKVVFGCQSRCLMVGGA